MGRERLRTLVRESKKHEISGVRVVEVRHSGLVDALTSPQVQGSRLKPVAKFYGGLATAELVKDGFQIGGSVLTIGVPRGGFPFAQGAHEFVSSFKGRTELGFSNSGEGSNDGEKLPFRVEPDVETILLVDGVIGSGGEVNEHIDHLMQRLPSGWSGNIGVVSGAAASFGLENIVNNVGTNYPGVRLGLSTGRLYKEGEYQGWTQVAPNKQVFFVGVGDMGGRVQGDATIEELYMEYGLGAANA